MTPRTSLLLFITCLALSACALDSPRLGRVQVGDTIESQGHLFRVYRHPQEDTVEAHRINPVFPPPSRLAILAAAYEAITRATGCDIRKGSLKGDQAIVIAKLKGCP